jgi:hypothetical protein
MAGKVHTFTGHLDLELFPGPPNYESTDKGDRADRIFMLTLARPVCANDAKDHTITPEIPVTRIHVVGPDAATRDWLASQTGRTITLSGRTSVSLVARQKGQLIVFLEPVAKTS